MKRLLTLGLVLSLGACAYYNGLYNANRLADEARKAEREGRIGEARSLWSRAAVKAESVAIRYPSSRWRDDAWLLWGESLRRMDACQRATEPLQLAIDSSIDLGVVDAARLVAAECRLFMREPGAALVLLGPVADSDRPHAAEARALRARTYLAAGQWEGALADARSAGPAGAMTAATALARMGRGGEAATAMDGRLRAPLVEAEWREALAALSPVAPADAARLALAVGARGDVSPGVRARLLLAEGERALGAGQEAWDLFTAARAVAPDSVEGRVAEAFLVMLRLNRPVAADSIAVMLAAVRRVTAPGGRAVQIVGRGLTVLPNILTAVENRQEPAGLFLAAELARDSLRTPGLAGGLFLEVARRVDDEALAPKAIVAAMEALPAARDSLRTVLATRYPASVYYRALLGDMGERYRIVEDSLHAVFVSLRAQTP